MTRFAREDHVEVADLLLSGPFHHALRAAIRDSALTLERLRCRVMQADRLGRVERHPSEPVLIAEYLFDVVLRAGETWVFEHAVVDHSGQAGTECGYGFRHPVSQYVLEVRFHPERLPAGCYSYARHGLSGPLLRTGSLAMNPHHAVHLSAIREADDDHLCSISARFARLPANR
ncbi:hypothetical protein N5079_11970 [Planotetraspora sp. A-T 1434]|uniref:hypothetical protein n=1 Tax=Planotetraspora sp. A-T 1434 TaxID=2979219 RepID=UPI0021BDFA09|nr:hypothetical protein [Planotetraspora sp. A-T 1434]MCT9930936.1 hypothetical protein [Planotetraspora sp. A-T 1434]